MYCVSGANRPGDDCFVIAFKKANLHFLAGGSPQLDSVLGVLGRGGGENVDEVDGVGDGLGMLMSNGALIVSSSPVTYFLV